MENKTFKIEASKSIIEWIGRKVTGAHNGTIGIKEGSIIIRDGRLSGGIVVADVKNITILDVTDPTYNAQFAAHLASDDFFSTDQFPEAVLEITSVSGNSVHANLTIKGITHPVVFDASVTIHGNDLKANALVIVDRTKYDMKFRSGNFFVNLGDTLIYNDFELKVSLTASAVKNLSHVSL